MTVEELINQLQFMDPTAEVHFTYNYGDHWRTQVAPEVSSVEPGFVVNSEYHRMPKVVEPDWDDEDAESPGTEVVLIG